MRKFIEGELTRSIQLLDKHLGENGEAPTELDVFFAFSFFLAFVGKHISDFSVIPEQEFYEIYCSMEQELERQFDLTERCDVSLDQTAAEALSFLKVHDSNIGDAAQAYFHANCRKLSVTETTFLAATLAPCTAFPYALIDERGI